MSRALARAALSIASRGNGALLVAVTAAAVLFWNDSEPARNFGLLLSLSIALPVALWRIILQARQAAAAESSAQTSAQSQTTAHREALDNQLRTGTEMLTSDSSAARAAGAFLLERLAVDHSLEYDQVVSDVLAAASDSEEASGNASS